MNYSGGKPLVRSDAAPIGPPRIVVVKSVTGTYFTYANGIAVGIRIMFWAPIGMVLVMLAFTLTRGRGLSTALWIGFAVQILVLFLFCGVLIVHRLNRWKIDLNAYRQEHSNIDHPDASYLVKGALLEVGGLCRIRWWSGRPAPAWRHRFQQLLHERGLPHALVIVQAELIDKLRMISVDETFVEPDRLLAQMSRRSGTFWMLAAMLLMSGWVMVQAALRGDWVMASVLGVAAAMVGSQLLKSWGIHVSQANAPVMGMGVLSDHKGRRWTVLDSAVYLYPYQSSIIASLLGPNGYHAMQFHGVEDPALRMFWQRWMHPHPRPDLV
ncbi:MAG: hypothetical protein KJZ69_12390 [Phycisphaerales bacterium]|nr:hypothetical protein [Phycisphaerales bacterium]